MQHKIIHFRETKKSKRKWQLVYNTRRKSYRLIVNRVAMDGYVFYSVLNTDIAMELDVAASIVRTKECYYIILVSLVYLYAYTIRNTSL